MKCELYVAMAVMLCAFMAPLASAEVYRVSDLDTLADLLPPGAAGGLLDSQPNQVIVRVRVGEPLPRREVWLLCCC